MQYVIFDDNKRENFFPLTFTRSSGDLRLGILKLRQRIQAYFGIDKTSLIVSTDLENIYRERHSDWQVNKLIGDDIILLNSRLKVDEQLVDKIDQLTFGSCLIQADQIIAARGKFPFGKIASENLEGLFSNLKAEKYAGNNLWNYTWELIENNAEYIEQDFQNFFYNKDNFFATPPGVTFINPYNIWLGEGSSLAPGVVLDAAEGPIIIDEKAAVMANAVIVGPAYIGKNSKIKIGAKIYQGTSIGPACKVGGEVEQSIFQAFSNKQHDGFLGHSYLGEWINLGADTNNSDLKNNYKNVEFYFYPEQRKIASNTQFMGTIIGDHSKTGINATINTGAVIGIGCNLFDSELIRNHVASFKWGKVDYGLEVFLETANLVKQRRGLELSASEKELYSIIRKFVLEQNKK